MFRLHTRALHYFSSPNCLQDEFFMTRIIIMLLANSYSGKDLGIVLEAERDTSGNTPLTQPPMDRSFKLPFKSESSF